MHAGTALRFGLAFDRHYVYCCASLTALLLANGVMDLRAMALVRASKAFRREVRGSRELRATELA